MTMFLVIDGGEVVAEFGSYAEARDFADGEVNLHIRERRSSPQLTPGTVVVAKHPVYRGAWWGTITAIDGENAAVLFKHDKSGTPVRLPTAILLAPVMPQQYRNDGVGEHYWRKHCEVEAELLAFRHDPANQGKVFWPETYID